MCIVLLAPAARAAGLNLGWGAFCPTNASSLVNVNDPCDGSVAVPYTLIGSVVAPNPAPSNCVAEDFFIDLQENAVALSDYWKLESENQPGYSNLAGCRGNNSGNSNVASVNVGVLPALFVGAYTGCNKNLMGSTAFGGINYGVLNPDAYPGIVDARRARLIGHFARSPGAPMITGTQYLSFIATIDTNHQISDPTNPPAYVCAGCADGVCLVFNELILYQASPAPNFDVTNEDTRRTVTWQGGGFDCTTVPVKRATWGQVKSLYR